MRTLADPKYARVELAEKLGGGGGAGGRPPPPPPPIQKKKEKREKEKNTIIKLRLVYSNV